MHLIAIHRFRTALGLYGFIGRAFVPVSQENMRKENGGER
jgi:hypothetical protein